MSAPQSSGSGYDLSPTTFSPDGRLFQVEYANKAVENSGTAIGIRCVDGVVLGVEKILLSTLLKPGGNKQIATMGAHAGLAFSGWAPDARQLLERGRDEVYNYEETYGGVIPPEVLAERMAQYVHYFTIHGALRPFGVGAIVAAYDPETKNHALHMIEPNGVQYRYFGCALGKVGRTKGETPALPPHERREAHYTILGSFRGIRHSCMHGRSPGAMPKMEPRVKGSHITVRMLCAT